LTQVDGRYRQFLHDVLKARFGKRDCTRQIRARTHKDGLAGPVMTCVALMPLRVDMWCDSCLVNGAVELLQEDLHGDVHGEGNC
jgi:hypothetical protein